MIYKWQRLKITTFWLSTVMYGCEFTALLNPVTGLMAKVTNVIFGRLTCLQGGEAHKLLPIRQLWLKFGAMLDPVTRYVAQTTDVIPRW